GREGDIGRQEDQELGLDLGFDGAFEEIAKVRNVADEGNLLNGLNVNVLHESADDDSFAVFDGDACLDGANIEDRSEDVGGDGYSGSRIELGNLGGDVEGDKSIGVNVGDDVENDADLIVADGVDSLSIGRDLGVGDVGDLLADDHGGFLI